MPRRLPVIRLVHALAALLAVIWIAQLFVPELRAQTAASLSPSPNLQFFDASSGISLPCVNCTLSTFAAGTNTPLKTYVDSTGTAQNPVIITLDAQGYTTSGIWLGTSCYKYVLANARGATVWTQDHICGAQVSLNALQTSLAGTTGAAQIGFVQSGAGATPQTMQAKARQTVNVLDYGAVCDGTTDDRASIQSAVNAVGAGTLYLPNGRPCAIGSPGLILYPTNGGLGKNSVITIAGQSAATNFAGSGGGLIATASNPPQAMLTVYAQNAQLRNLFVDCNSKKSTYGIVSVFGLNGVWDNPTVRNCSSDGARLDMFYTPTTNITAGGTVGSGAVTLASVTNNGICTFGNSSTAQTCAVIVFDYGTANAEAFAISSVAGNVVNISGTLAHDHTGGVAQAQGNNNTMQISHLATFSNGGWGFHVTAGNDNNGIHFSNHSSNGNALGGELWHGLLTTHIGGSYQGDTGPMIQLGDTSETGFTGYGYFGPVADAEESKSIYNSIWAYCSDNDQVQFNTWKALTVLGGCPTYPTITAAGGFGTEQDQNGTPSFFMKNGFGTVPITVGRGNTSGSCEFPGQILIVPIATTQLATYQYCISGASTSITNTTSANPAVLTTSSAPSSGYVLISGYTGACQFLNGPQTATNISGTTFSIPVDTTSFGSCAGTPVVQTATWSSTSPTAAAASCINGCFVQPDITGSGCANTTICVTYPDATGSTSWTRAPGNEIKVRLVHYTLHSGGSNTINVNGSVVAIGSNWNIANPIGTDVALGAVIDLIYGADNNWHLYGQ